MKWVLFRVPCPTPDGRTARDLYAERVTWISQDMQESARRHGCGFHRVWHASDGSAFYVLTGWQTQEGARAFYREWQIDIEPGEEAIPLEGDIGLVPLS